MSAQPASPAPAARAAALPAPGPPVSRVTSPATAPAGGRTYRNSSPVMVAISSAGE